MDVTLKGEKTMRVKKDHKSIIFNILRHNLLFISIIAIIVFAGIAVGGNFIVKEGAVTSSNSISSQKFIDNSLMAYWKFNSNASNDSTERNNSGTFRNGAHAMNDVLELDGTNDYVTVSDVTYLSPANFTISVWFSLKGSNSGQTILSRPINGPPWTNPYLSWLIRVNNLTRIEVDTGNFAYYSATSFNVDNLKLNEWHNLVVTYYNKNLTVYLDGTSLGFYSTVLAYNMSTPLLIGADYGANPAAGYFNGSIDELRIYDRALSHWEVSQLYESQDRNRGYFNKVIIGNADISWDGNKLMFNTNRSAPSNASSGIAWFSANVSAKGYFTRTFAWDVSQYGNALDYIRNDYLDKSRGIKEIDHSKYSPPEYVQYEVIDYENCHDKSTDQVDSLTGESKKVTVCGTKMEEGVLLDASVAKHEQALYELKQEIIALKSEIAALKGVSKTVETNSSSSI